jgi:hypothetical protein
VIPGPGRRHQDFRVDPGWESFRSHLIPNPVPIVRQGFGYRATTHAGGAQPGEVGGWIQRSITPAYYAKAIPTRTLQDRLTASGKFAVTRADGSSGMLFGWFHKDAHGWRTPNSLAFRIDGNGGKYWVFYEYGTRHWLTAGGGTFEGEHYQTTPTKPFPADGTVHTWALAYDPNGNQGNGELLFTLDGKEFRRPLAPGHKADGAEFDRFGMFNQMTTGGGMEVYFDDLVIDGRPERFEADPRWDARGSEVEFPEPTRRPNHDFGYRQTTHAGGSAGEVGGIVWRDERPAYYADRVGPLTLEDELFASGKLAFTGAGSDSGVYLGWFDAKSKQDKSTPEHQEAQKNTLAILIEGPSRIGHYFRPAYSTVSAQGAKQSIGPVIRPDGRVHQWSLLYSPRGADGNGRITVTLDGAAQTLDLRPGDRQIGATFDRFGFFNVQSGGNHVYVYIDDLIYTGGSRQEIRKACGTRGS